MYRHGNMKKRFLSYLQENDINILAALIFSFVLSGLLSINGISSQYSHQATSIFDYAQLFLSVLWLLPLPIAFVSFVGILLFRNNNHLKHIDVPDIGESMIYFRLVTRGINQQTVIKSAESTILQMEKFNGLHLSAIPYKMEIFTEKASDPLEHALLESAYAKRIDLYELAKEYQTSNNALYKARALHFAIEHSRAKPHDWIFHLDDESRIDQETIMGILDFVSREEIKKKTDPWYHPKIGQGAILYHRDMRKNLLYSLADSIRTADDIGRYFLQYIFGLCIFGMHGSFILVRNSIEQSEGFDLLPHYCITEDAYWGLKLMQKGFSFGFVSGFVHEQSPHKGFDFIKQRRRWFVGLREVIKAHDIALRYKGILFLSTLLWAFSGLIVLYTALNILHPIAVPVLVSLLSAVAFSIYILMYIIGFYLNSKYQKLSGLTKLYYLLFQIVLIPIFSILEAAGATYGMIDRKLNFHVIRK